MKSRTAFFPYLLAVLLAALICLGMSGMGGTTSDKFPKPKKNFEATIIDTQMMQTKADLLACDGSTYLTAYRGKSKVRVPFSKIEAVAFSAHDNRYKRAVVKFWNGHTHDLLVKKYQICTGRTEMGELSIKVKHLKEVIFEKGPYTEGHEDGPETQAP